MHFIFIQYQVNIASITNLRNRICGVTLQLRKKSSRSQIALCKWFKKSFDVGYIILECKRFGWRADVPNIHSNLSACYSGNTELFRIWRERRKKDMLFIHLLASWQEKALEMKKLWILVVSCKIYGIFYKLVTGNNKLLRNICCLKIYEHVFV